MAWADGFKIAASENTSFEMNFFRITGTSEAENSVNGKAECLLSNKKVRLLE